jgi:predicted methyltransferase
MGFCLDFVKIPYTLTTYLSSTLMTEPTTGTPLTEDVKNEDTGPLPRGKIVFYCKTCKKIVDAERIGKKYQYKCPLCKGTDVAFGTEMSIKSVYDRLNKKS